MTQNHSSQAAELDTDSMSDDHPQVGRWLGWKTRLLIAFSLVWLGPTLACGSFAPRPTPSPTPAATPAPPAGALPAETPTPAIQEAAPVVEAAPTIAPLVVPTATVAAPPAAPLGGNVLAVGQPARVTAPNGLNMRDRASSAGTLIIQLGTGQRVTVLEGPAQAEGFTWWRVDDGAGRSGWVAQGDAETQWLNAQVGEPQPANRAPRVGERVVVAAAAGQLSVRATPGTGAVLMTQVNAGSQFTVLAGPQSVDGFSWFQIRSDDGSVEGWVADGDGTNRWLSPLE